MMEREEGAEGSGSHEDRAGEDEVRIPIFRESRDSWEKSHVSQISFQETYSIQ